MVMRLFDDDLLNYGDYQLFRAFCQSIEPQLNGAHFGRISLYKRWYSTDVIYKHGHVTDVSFNFHTGMIRVPWFPGFEVAIANPACNKRVTDKICEALTAYIKHTPSAQG